METITKIKYENFLAEPMGDKPVNDLPALNEHHSSVLKNSGYEFVIIINFSIIPNYLIYKHILSKQQGIHIVWTIFGAIKK